MPQDILKRHPQHKQASRGERRRNRQQRHNWLTIGLIALVVLLVGGLLLWPRPGESVDAARLADDPALGAPGAKVTIVEYGDFGCTACRAWHQAGILDQVLAQYGDQVRFVWRDFPVITPQSPKAAEAGQCAYDQGKFWEYHDLLYERAPALAIGDLKAYAVELGLDVAEFNQCLDSGQHQATIDHDLQDALGRGFRGTPSFLMNTQPLIGPPSLSALQNLIDPLLTPGGF